ncbi:MAG: carbohydrate porin [Chthoniobacterales bacterium]|nr:carbohydrate porin [Chthoniobacterales bacterium]
MRPLHFFTATVLCFSTSLQAALLSTTNGLNLSENSPYNTIADVPHTIMEYERASGNWFGWRESLESKGVGPSITYTADMAGNPVGGKSPGGFTYTDSFAFACLVETEKLFGWHGGYFMVSAIQRDGSNLSQQNIRNAFTVQQIYGGPTIHWYQLSYQQDFWNDRVSLKIGRIAVGDDFETSPLYWLYMNNGIDGMIQAVPVNSRASVCPNATWGSYLKAKLPADMLLKLGVYQAVPQPSTNGLNWNFYPSNGVMLFSQYEWTPEFFKSSFSHRAQPTNKMKEARDLFVKPPGSRTNLPASVIKGFQGHYWMGGYYSSMEYSQFNSTLQIPNAYGFYWHADQTVYRPEPTSDKGLVLWSACALSPQQNISLLPFQVNAGAIYTGLIPGRSEDLTIFGAAYGNFSTSYAGVQEAAGNGNRTYELVYEGGYRILLTKFAYFQPDIQWVINPGGSASIANALVLGAQMGVVF